MKALVIVALLIGSPAFAAGDGQVVQAAPAQIEEAKIEKNPVSEAIAKMSDEEFARYMAENTKQAHKAEKVRKFKRAFAVGALATGRAMQGYSNGYTTMSQLNYLNRPIYSQAPYQTPMMSAPNLIVQPSLHSYSVNRTGSMMTVQQIY